MGTRSATLVTTRALQMQPAPKAPPNGSSASARTSPASCTPSATRVPPLLSARGVAQLSPATPLSVLPQTWSVLHRRWKGPAATRRRQTLDHTWNEADCCHEVQSRDY